MSGDRKIEIPSWAPFKIGAAIFFVVSLYQAFSRGYLAKLLQWIFE